MTAVFSLMSSTSSLFSPFDDSCTTQTDWLDLRLENIITECFDGSNQTIVPTSGPLTGETPAAANDSSQQTAKHHYRITVYYTSIDKVVSELHSRFEGNDQEVLCAFGEIIFSRSPSINNIQTVSNFYGVDSEMLSSEKSIFENYDSRDPCQRKNAAVMVKTMHQNDLHDILPVLYKVASILATIPATLCSAERSFSALCHIKTFLKSTMGQDPLDSIAIINIEREYANKTMQNDMQRIWVSKYW